MFFTLAPEKMRPVGEPHPSRGHARRLLARMRTCAGARSTSFQKSTTKIVYDRKDKSKLEPKENRPPELFGLTAKKTSPRTDISYVMSSAFSNVVAENVLILWTIRFERSILAEYIYQDAQCFSDACLIFLGSRHSNRVIHLVIFTLCFNVLWQQEAQEDMEWGSDNIGVEEPPWRVFFLSSTKLF